MSEREVTRDERAQTLAAWRTITEFCPPEDERDRREIAETIAMTTGIPLVSVLEVVAHVC